MKHTYQVLSCSCVLFLSLLSPAISDFAPTPGKSSVIVLQAEVTIDGQQRPDLGRSFADTITGGLLKTNAYSVIDHLGNQPLSQAIERNSTLAPEQSAVAIGQETGARWIFVPRMVVEGDFNKLTLKKIRVSDGLVADVFETHATGGRETMFLLIGDALKYINKETARDPARLGKTPTGEPLPIPEPELLDPTPLPIPGSYEPLPPTPDPDPTPATQSMPEQTEVVSADKMSVPEGLKFEDGTFIKEEEPATTPELVTLPIPDPPQITDPATEMENKYARLMGTIRTVNPEWRFCILKLSKNQSLRVGDQLSIKTGTIVPNEVALEVTKVEGTQVVADLIDAADLDTIKVGQSFYKWTPR